MACTGHGLLSSELSPFVLCFTPYCLLPHETRIITRIGSNANAYVEFLNIAVALIDHQSSDGDRWGHEAQKGERPGLRWHRKLGTELCPSLVL